MVTWNAKTSERPPQLTSTTTSCQTGQAPNQGGADMTMVNDYAHATDATVERAVKHFAEGYN
jgi:hypothetical protein